MGISFNDRVKNAYLTDTEEVIIRKITANLNKTAFLSGAHLAEECGVSASFITRLAQKLGYPGFAGLKQDLEQLYKQETTPYEMFKTYLSEPKEVNIAHTSISQDLQNLISLQRNLDEKTLEEVITCIEQSKNVYLSAMFATECNVTLLSYYLSRIGKPNIPLTGIGLSKKIEYSDICSEDVLIAFSSLRIAREVLDAVNFAKSIGVKTIAITDTMTNPLALASDFVLIAPVKGATVDYSHGATVSMVNIIINSLAERNSEQILKRLEEVKKRWKKKKYFVT